MTDRAATVRVCLPDHERPLDEAGRESAREVATKLKSAGWLPKLVLCRCALAAPAALRIRFVCKLSLVLVLGLRYLCFGGP